MRHGAAGKRPCVWCTVSRHNIISGEMGCEMSTIDTESAGNQFLKTPRNNTKSVKNGKAEPPEEKEECGEHMLKKNSLLTKPPFNVYEIRQSTNNKQSFGVQN